MTLYELLSVTAWEMTKPQPYGLFHIVFTFLGGGVSVFAAWKLRDVSEKAHHRILLTVGILLAMSEVYKQLFYTYYLNDGVYKWSILPFQLCSVPMYLCLLAPRLPEGRVKQLVHEFMFSYNMLGGIMSFVVPSGLCHEYWTLTLHAFVWHMLLVFLGLYLAVSGRAGKSAGAFVDATKLFLLLCGVAVGINVALSGISAGAVNMFYLGPGLTPQPVFHEIALQFGQPIASVLYIGSIILGAYILRQLLSPLSAQRKFLTGKQV